MQKIIKNSLKAYMLMKVKWIFELQIAQKGQLKRIIQAGFIF